MCRRYNQRPSQVLDFCADLPPDVRRIMCLDFDMAMAAVHKAEEEANASNSPLASALAMLG